jgi:hypothetical protein
VSGDAGVVDENVQAAKLAARGIKCAASGGLIRYVADNGNCSAAGFANLLDDFGKPILAPRKKYGIDAAPRKFNRQRPADAA